MDSTPKPSLVEVLRSRAAVLDARSKFSSYDEGARDALNDAAAIAAPYSARLAALERVFEAARDYMTGGISGLELRSALAAVPEIPEKTDG